MATLLVVTGASRGLGRAISVAFAAASTEFPSVRALLISRSEEGLIETTALMKDAADGSSTSLDASYAVVDLSDTDTLEDELERIFRGVSSSSEYDRVILINNAGSLGYLGRCADMPSLQELRDAVNFNVTSSIWISSRFVKHFARGGGSLKSPTKCVVVNISSLCAIEPFSTMSTYCAGKAARDMFHKILAKEEDGSSVVKVLNYAPGMCETQMSLELAECERLDPDLGNMYKMSWEQKTMVRPKETAEKLVQIVFRDEFESGKHIDFWD